MKCKDLNRSAIMYIDGELSIEHTKELEDHLRLCKKCSANFETIKSIYSKIEASKNEASVNPYFASKVIERIKVEREPRIITHSALRYVTITSMAVAATILGILIGSLYTKSTVSIQTSTDQSWEQLADEYIPDTESNPYELINDNNLNTIP